MCPLELRPTGTCLAGDIVGQLIVIQLSYCTKTNTNK